MDMQEKNKMYRETLEQIQRMVPRYYGMNILRQFKEKVTVLVKEILIKTKDEKDAN